MQGHIRRRAKGSWTVVVDLGRHPQSAKRRQLWRSVKGTKRDAEALLVHLLHQRETGVDAPPGRLTVAEYLQQWLDAYVRPNTAPKTLRRYEQLIRVHLAPALGSIQLTKLRPLHIQEAYTNVVRSGRSARTALHCHRVLREALQHAVKWQLLGRNPADAVDSPRPERHEIPAVTPEAVQKLLAAAEQTSYGAMIHTAVATGLRLGELTGLRWQDIDLAGGVLSVRQTCQWLSREGFLYRQPKSYRSARPVALSPSTINRLRQHRRAQLEERLSVGPAYLDSDLVFADAVGGPCHPSTLRKAWLGITACAGMSGFRFHDLRHAHASLLLRQGVHPKIVSERLGHSTVGITLDVYSHVTPNLQAAAAKDFDRVLGKA
jgi:integrase